MKHNLGWNYDLDNCIEPDTNSAPLIHEDMMVNVGRKDLLKKIRVSLCFRIKPNFSVEHESVIKVLREGPNDN